MTQYKINVFNGHCGVGTQNPLFDTIKIMKEREEKPEHMKARLLKDGLYKQKKETIIRMLFVQWKKMEIIFGYIQSGLLLEENCN